MRASRIVGTAADEKPIDAALLADEAERELVAAVGAPAGSGASHDDDFAWATSLATVVERFFTDVLVMAEDEALRDEPAPDPRGREARASAGSATLPRSRSRALAEMTL